MAGTSIQQAIKTVVDRFTNRSTREESRTLIREAQALVQRFYAEGLETTEALLDAAAQKNPPAMHRLTADHFGFNVYEQPSYNSVDDFAWASSQRYTTLEGVDLPSNAHFFDSKRNPLTKGEMERLMADGNHHLFDIALSNEYVLLGADEKFNVEQMEQRFSTNNEHLVPQSKSRTEGGTRVFKADPRMIVISDVKTNGERSNLQVVFLDENGHAMDSISLIIDETLEEPVLVRRDCTDCDPGSASAARRYPIGPEDAPHYAYALALCYFAGGMNARDAQSWFDREQAQEVAKMLKKLGQHPVEQNREPVLRDLLADAKVLAGRINPVALLPNAFAGALQTEIDQKQFRGRRANAKARLRTREAETSHVEALVQERQARQAGGVGR